VLVGKLHSRQLGAYDAILSWPRLPDDIERIIVKASLMHTQLMSVMRELT
jgi:hypothetical protein